MSFGRSNTETRILQMQLENKDFEEGVRQTIRSLENLEEKLNLKNAGDGFEKVSAAANSVQTSHLENGIDSITSKFTLMGQIGLQALERISSKVVDTGTKILRAATIQPMIDGWGEFEMKTNSVQTILGGIRNKFDDQPTAIAAISDALDELNEYADKTIYNFAQMTENVGKFTNQGLGLEESTNAIKGIANWAAAVGANPEQMSRAMYNISQSLGAGSMQLIDWRSIRFANMATPEVKKLFAEVAKRYGTIGKDGIVQYGKKEFNVLEDFEGSLKAGWLTNDVMAEAFSIYAKAFSREDLIAKYGEELGNQFYEMGAYAEEAATKVRTFSQLLGVLKESLGSGWANTFDILFGGFEQQTAFLTAIKERIEEIINFQTDDRNSFLQNLSDIGGIKSLQDAFLETIDILKEFYWVFNDVIGVLLNPFVGEEVWSESVFGPRQEGYTNMLTTWESTKAIFDDILGTLRRFHTWLKASDEKTGRSPIQNLANALSGVAGAAGIVFKVLTNVGKLVFRVFRRFEPLVSSVLDLFGQIGATIYNLFFNLSGQGSIEEIFDRIGDAIEPVIDFVVGLASAVVNLIHNLLGIDSAADDWTVLANKLSAFWDIFKYDPNLDFATNLKRSIEKALIAVFGPETAAEMKKAWKTNIAPIASEIGKAFEQAFGELNRIFNGLSSAFGADYSNTKNGPLTFLRSFFEGYYGDDKAGSDAAYANVLGIYMQIEDYYNENVAPHVDALTKIFTVTLPDLNRKIREFLFGSDTTVMTGPGQSINQHKNGLIDNLIAMFSTDNIESVLSQIRTFFAPITQALSDAWGEFYGFFVGRDVEVLDNGRWRQGHQTGLFEIIEGFFNGTTWDESWKTIQDAFSRVTSWITSDGNPAWGIIMDFLFGPEKTANVNGPGQAQTFRTGGVYDEAMKFLTPVWEWVKSTLQPLYDYIIAHDFSKMWAGLNELLFGYDTTVVTGPGQAMTNHANGLLDPILTILQPIADVFNQMKGWALEKLSGIDWGGIWESVGKFFSGYDELVVRDGGRTKEIVHHNGLFENIASFFERVIAFFETPEVQAFIGKVKEVLGWISGLGGELWGAISGLFGGKGLGGFEKVGNYLAGGIDKLLPEGMSLSGILSSFLGGGTGKNGEAKTEESGSEDGGFLKILEDTGLLGKAGAAEAEINTITGELSWFVGEAEAAAQTTEQATDKGASAFDTILGSMSKFLPYIGGAAAIGLTGKVSDMIVGITGNRKPTILEQIAGLLTAIGEPLKGLGIALAGAGIAEKLAPGTIDKVFNHIFNILKTLFGWVSAIAGGGMLLSFGTNVGGNALTNKMFGGASGSKVAESINFDSASSIIASIGTGISGLFEGLQTMYNLVWEVMAADFIMGFDEKGVANFDKRLDRVLGFVGDILDTLLSNQTVLSIIDTAFKVIGAGASKLIGVEVKTSTMADTLKGLGLFISAVGDGVAAIMTASIVPGILNIDTSKIVDIINALFTGLSALTGITEIGSLTALLGDKAGWASFKALAGTGGGLAVALGAIGTVAGFLFKWYKQEFKEGLEDISGPLYTFSTNFSSAMTAIGKLKETQIADAGTVLKDNLPEIYRAIADTKTGYNKDAIEERGNAIRDFGIRVNTGVSSLVRAKEAFDKYNTGDENSFPLAFFEAMTEALEYLNTNGVKELYDEFFKTGFGEEYTPGSEKGINSLTGFFSSIGMIGSVIVENTDLLGRQQKVVSLKEGFDAFVDAFGGIRDIFSSIVSSMGRDGFSVEKLDSLTNFMTKLSEAVTAYAESYGSVTETADGTVYRYYRQNSPFSDFGSWLNSTGQGIRDLDNALKNSEGKYNIDYTQLESALNAIRPLADIAGQINDLDKNGFRLEDLAWDMNRGDHYNFADGLAGFLDKIGSEEVDAGIAKANSILPSISSFLTGIGDIMSIEQETGDRNRFRTTLSGVFGALSTEMNTLTTEKIDGYATSLQNLKNSVTGIDGATSLATMIQQIFDQIGDKEVKLKITPVFDDASFSSNMNLPENMQMPLNNVYSRNITLQVNMNEVQNVRIDSSQIAALVAANNSTRDQIGYLAQNINGIAEAVRAMKIILDTGVIAGAVDEYLGYSTFIASRTG